MSRYKPYPAYKDSGVEWLGEVPEHWEIMPMWSVYRPVKRTGFIMEPLLSVYRDYGIVLKDSRDDNRNRASDDLNPYQLVERGNLVTNKMKTWQGSIAVSELRGIVSPAYFIYEPIRNVFDKFIHYLMRSSPYITGYMSISKGIRVGQWDLDPELFRTFPILFPCEGEQKQIVEALDRETARIDALIAKKSRFVELLREKRQAFITHAVTKGLDPSVKMKDSGVEWLGEVPEHWDVRPIKSLATESSTLFIDGDWIESHNLSSTGVRYITTGNVSVGVYKEQGHGFITEETFRKLQCTEVLPGDILVSRLNPPIGRACIVPDLGLRIVTSVDNVILRPNGEFDPQFVVFRWSAIDYFHELSLLASGATMQRVSRTDLGNIRIAWPPLSEQIKIRHHLHEETSRIDALITKTQRSIDLLKERRSAFITAAVTGQINLRESK